MGKIEVVKTLHICECGKTDYVYIKAKTEKHYDSLESQYQKMYIMKKRKKKFERILNNNM